MSDRIHRAVCVAAILLALGGATVGFLQGGLPWASARDAALPALWLGVVLPQVTFAVVQSLPGGRRRTTVLGARTDGWLLAMFVTMLGAMLPILNQQATDAVSHLFELALTLVSVGLMLARARQLRPGGAASPT